MCSKEVQLSQLNKLIITYKEIYNPTTDEDIADYDAFVDFIEYAEELKRLSKELLSDDDKKTLQDYNNLPFELEHELINSLKTKIKCVSNSKHQKVDNYNYYINTISDVKKRSKAGIPQIDNITATKTLTTKDEHTINYKGQIETYKEGEFNDLYISHIKLLLTTSCYELIPYSSYNIYGCQYVKTCFNTIGKDYEYISPFIDYDLTELEKNTTFKKAINECKDLINDFMNSILIDVDFKRLSIVGYSNIKEYKEILKLGNGDEIGYIHIQHKPNSGKALSLHIVFSDIKIHVLEFIARINDNLSILEKHKAFDKAPYLTGSLRHMASPKSGLSEHAEDKQVDDLSITQILDQFITYYNTRTVKTKIELDYKNIHNKQTFNPIKFNTTLNEYRIKLIYGGHEIDNIESIIKSLATNEIIKTDYSGRWKWLSKYVIYKKSLNQQITDTEINNLLPGAHDHLKSQIEFLTKSKSFIHPKILLTFIKQLIPSEFDYEITDLSNEKYVKPKHFGQCRIEEMIKCKSFKELIEIITGSFAIADDGVLHYACENGVREYKIGGRPNLYVAKYYPSRLSFIINEEDLGEDDEGNITQNIALNKMDGSEVDVINEDSLLNTLLKNRMLELANSKRKKQIQLTADLFIKLLYKYYDTYEESAETRFKLNGYSLDKIKPKVYEDVKTIIKLFEDRLVKETKTYDNLEDKENRKEIDNPLQEFLRSIKYLLVNHEKPEKAFLAIDKFGSTGKSLFFSKIINDFFGLAGLNDDSLNCLDSTFSDAYNYFYTIYNEVSKGKHTIEQCSSKIKQFTDNVMASARVKNIQNMKTFKNIGLTVLLSNSETLDGALDYNDTALMSRLVYIEFKPFETDGDIDALKGSEYYKLIDKYKSYRDRNHLFTYDFRNALFKYIMELDISSRTFGRAQPSEYKNQKYIEIAKDKIKETMTQQPNIYDNCIYKYNMKNNTLSKLNYQENYEGLIAFGISNLKNAGNADKKKDFMKVLNYKTALNIKRTYKINDDLKDVLTNKDGRYTFIICDYTRFIEFVEIEPHIDN